MVAVLLLLSAVCLGFGALSIASEAGIANGGFFLVIATILIVGAAICHGLKRISERM